MSKSGKSEWQILLDALAGILEKPLGIHQYHGRIFLTMLGSDKKKMRKMMPQYEQTNRKIWLLVLVLCAFGLIIQYSASSYMCSNSKVYNNDPFYLVTRQAIYMLAAFAAMWIIQFINYQILFSRLAFLLYGGAICSLLLLETGMAVEIYGAKRWISLGGFTFAPAELVKIAVFVMLAYMAERYPRSLRKVSMTIYMWMIGGVPAVLVYSIANDLSSAAVILLITFGITIVTTRTWFMHLLVAAAIFGGAAIVVITMSHNMPTVEAAAALKSFRAKRIYAWLAPETYYSNIGYQTANTLYICGAGGWLGKGLGSFRQLAHLVPIAYTDVIFGVLVYELGIVGAGLALLLYGLLLKEIAVTVIRARDLFGSVISMGIFLHIFVQILIHCGVVLNLIPNTGQTLPWFSYGGSNILCLGAEIGLLLSVVRVQQMHMAKVESESHAVVN